MALLTKIGYGQVEPNHLSAQRTGQIYAQNKWVPATETVLQNGAFLKFNGTVTGTGEFMLVFNEIKLYNPTGSKQGYKDFAVTVGESLSGEVVPRLFKINDGDIFTTNLVNYTTTYGSGLVGKLLVPTVASGEKTAVLTEVTTPSAGDMVFEVLATTTMPDGQNAVKVRKLYTAIA